MNSKPLDKSDSLTIADFAEVFGLPASAILIAIDRNRRNFNKPFYSIPELAERWHMSRAGVYNVLREHSALIVDFSQPGKSKGKKLVPASVVERIQGQRTKLIEMAV
jgi:hypothetical protein